MTRHDKRMASPPVVLLFALRDPQFADRAHEILLCGSLQLRAEKRAGGITRLSIILRGYLTVSGCSRLVAVGIGVGVIHRHELREIRSPSHRPRKSQAADADGTGSVASGSLVRTPRREGYTPRCPDTLGTSASAVEDLGYLTPHRIANGPRGPTVSCRAT